MLEYQTLGEKPQIGSLHLMKFFKLLFVLTTLGMANTGDRRRVGVSQSLTQRLRRTRLVRHPHAPADALSS